MSAVGAVLSLAACAATEQEACGCSIERDADADPERPEVDFDDADEVVVGTRIVAPEGAELVIVGGQANGLRTTSDPDVRVAAVPGTYQVVAYVHVPCGGPPDEEEARTITIVADASAGAAGPGPTGFASSPSTRRPAPTC